MRVMKWLDQGLGSSSSLMTQTLDPQQMLGAGPAMQSHRLCTSNSFDGPGYKTGYKTGYRRSSSMKCGYHDTWLRITGCQAQPPQQGSAMG